MKKIKYIRPELWDAAEKWLPVDEYMPTDETVLITYVSKSLMADYITGELSEYPTEVVSAYFQEGKWLLWPSNEILDDEIVLAWMPLPKDYEPIDTKQLMRIIGSNMLKGENE